MSGCENLSRVVSQTFKYCQPKMGENEAIYDLRLAIVDFKNPKSEIENQKIISLERSSK